VLGDYLAAVSARPTPSQQAVYVNCGTILPATVTRQAADAAAAGVLFVNCPVFGRPDAAAAGSLVAVPAGPPAGLERLAPLLPAFAKRGIWNDLGADPATAAALKLVGNFWIVSQMEVASQCLTLGAKCGIAGMAAAF
jgi:3-hydroxyisobutyrate dehydrogenase-like beta-hydroxyacid dehydrogenase